MIGRLTAAIPGEWARGKRKWDPDCSKRVQFTAIRVVCTNTLAMAEVRGDKGGEAGLNFQHRSDVEGTLAALHDVVDSANRPFAMNVEQFKFLASRHVQNLGQYFAQVINPELTAEGYAELVESQDLPRAIPQLVQNFEGGLGASLPWAHGTWWGAYNAVTEWTDHQRGTNVNRLDAAWFGEGRRIKERALVMAGELAQVA